MKWRENGYDQISKTTAKFGTNCAAEEFHHFLTIVYVNGNSNITTNAESRLQSLVTSTNDNCRVNIARNKGFSSNEHFASYKMKENAQLLPKIITEVVPSPTSSSWVRESSIMLFAAGCETSTSRRMLFPSFVNEMPPMGSRSIFNMERGPRVVRIISATAY